MAKSPPTLELDLLPEVFGVARLESSSPVPTWAESSLFASVTRTPTELSIVCFEASIPGFATAERGLRCLAVRGTLSFSETSILESLTAPLAGAQVSIFALSTYDTDYLLVPEAGLQIALRALREAGHTVFGCAAA